MKRLDLPELKEAFKQIGKIMKARSKKHEQLTENEVNKEVAAHRAGM
jgi:hypothetical protein